MPTYTRRITANLFQSGLVGTLAYRVVGVGDVTLIARTTAGIAEHGSSARYYVDIANWDTSWAGEIIWDAGAGDLAGEDFLAYTTQTGDSFARIGANGSGLTALGDARLAHLDADVSSAGGEALDAYQKAYLLGRVEVQPDGSWVYYDVDDPTLPRLHFTRLAAPGGRGVVKDPV